MAARGLGRALRVGAAAASALAAAGAACGQSGTPGPGRSPGGGAPRASPACAASAGCAAPAEEEEEEEEGALLLRPGLLQTSARVLPRSVQVQRDADGGPAPPGPEAGHYSRAGYAAGYAADRRGPEAGRYSRTGYAAAYAAAVRASHSTVTLVCACIVAALLAALLVGGVCVSSGWNLARRRGPDETQGQQPKVPLQRGPAYRDGGPGWKQRQSPSLPSTASSLPSTAVATTGSQLQRHGVSSSADLPVICPSLVLSSMPGHFYISMAALLHPRSIYRGGTTLDITGSSGRRKLLEAEHGFSEDGVWQLRLSSAGYTEEPRAIVEVNTTDRSPVMIYYGQEKHFFAILEDTGDPNQHVVSLPGKAKLKVLAEPGPDMRFKATAMDDLQIATAGRSGDQWKVEVSAKVDAVLIIACMLALTLGPGPCAVQGASPGTPSPWAAYRDSPGAPSPQYFDMASHRGSSAGAAPSPRTTFGPGALARGSF